MKYCVQHMQKTAQKNRQTIALLQMGLSKAEEGVDGLYLGYQYGNPR